MGRGTIVSHVADGLYSVIAVMNRDRIAANITRLTDQIAEIEAHILALDPEDPTIPIWELRKMSYEKEKARLEALPEDETISAWCADLTEDLSGSVGTIEVPGLPDTVLIQPGYDDNADYDEDRDGQLQFTMGQLPEQALYNLFMVTGWQKWMPTFRFGTISDKDDDANTATVLYDAQDVLGLNITANQAVSQSGVPFSYRECDSFAFLDGDHVLVQFNNQDWNDPVIIGFHDNPASCIWEMWDSDLLCFQHNWGIEKYDPWSRTLCPVMPFGDWSLVEDPPGSEFYYLKCDLTVGGLAMVTACNTVPGDNPGWSLDFGTRPRMRFKASASGPASGRYNSYIYLNVTEYGKTKNFWLYYARGPFSPTMTNVYVGDNGGAEQTIDLSSYGFNGPCTRVNFLVSSEYGDHVILTNDYITFDPPLP